MRVASRFAIDERTYFSDVTWRDESERALQLQWATAPSTQSLKKNDYVRDLHLPPFAPFCILTVQRPPASAIEYRAGNVAFVS